MPILSPKKTIQIIKTVDMELIIFIGLQGAGKSTFYKNYLVDSHIRLNGDMLKTCHREMTLFEACLKSKTNTVIDKTNPTIDGRSKYITLAKAHHFKVVAYYFDVAFHAALANNNQRTGQAKIPEVGLKSVAKQLTKPSLDEGFDEIVIITNTNNQFSITKMT